MSALNLPGREYVRNGSLDQLPDQIDRTICVDMPVILNASGGLSHRQARRLKGARFVSLNSALWTRVWS
jgi:hypothetical protein